MVLVPRLAIEQRTAWSTYLDFKGHDFLPRLMLQEARIMEVIAKNPHPHIIGYYGCRVKRGRIAGLVLEKPAFEHDLKFAENRPDLFKDVMDRDRILAGVRSVVDHLHSLGPAHNDPNPANILIGDGGEPKLIDYGSCQPFGKPLMSSGTPGWCKTRLLSSGKEHDEYVLELLGPWLDKIAISARDSVRSGQDLKLKVEDVEAISKVDSP